MRLLLLTLTALLAFSFVALHVITATFSGPYVYYHDPAAGIVIERVDGRGRQVVVPADMIAGQVGDMAWSASGEWLAWTLETDDGGATVWISRYDGGQHLRVPGNLGGSPWEWSPTTEQLLLSTSSGVFAIYDVPAAQIAYIFSSETVRYHWSPDGEHLVGVYWEPDRLRTSVLVRTLGGAGRELPPAIYSWTPDGRLAQWLDDRLTLEDLATGEQTVYQIEAPPPGYEVRWSPDGRHALAYTLRRDIYPQPDVWLASLQDETRVALPDDDLYVTEAVWGPTGAELALHGSDLRLYRLTTNTVTLGAVQLPQEVGLSAGDVNRVLAVSWLGQHLIESRGATVLYIPDDAPTIAFGAAGFVVAPDGQHVVLYDRVPNRGRLWIKDTRFRTVVFYETGLRIGRLLWHPGSEWLLTDWRNPFTGAGLAQVIDAAGVYNLVVTDWHADDITVRWLPQRVPAWGDHR